MSPGGGSTCRHDPHTLAGGSGGRVFAHALPTVCECVCECVCTRLCVHEGVHSLTRVCVRARVCVWRALPLAPCRPPAAAAAVPNLLLGSGRRRRRVRGATPLVFFPSCPCGKCGGGSGAGFTPGGISSCGGGQGGAPPLSMPLLPRSVLPALLRRLACPPAAPLRTRPAPAATPMDGPQAEALLAPLRQAVRHQVTRPGPAEGGDTRRGGPV